MIACAAMVWGVVRLTGANPLSGSGGILVGMLVWAASRRVRQLALLSRAVISTDTLITGLIDIMLCFPTFFLILAVTAFLIPSIWNIMIIIGLTSWMGVARLVSTAGAATVRMGRISARNSCGLTRQGSRSACSSSSTRRHAATSSHSTMGR